MRNEEAEKKKGIYLITLPHAGGSSNLYKNLGKNIECETLNIDYSGHWKRMNEPLATSFKELEDDVINIIRKTIPSGSRIIIFGHSLGAILAWEIIPQIVGHGIEICGLFLSACEDPGTFSKSKLFYFNEEKEIIPLLGIESKDIGSQFIDVFLPILENDLLLCREYKSNCMYRDIRAIIIYGSDDEMINKSDIKKWNKYVRIMNTIELEGDHFYLNRTENMHYICCLINQYVNRIIMGEDYN